MIMKKKSTILIATIAIAITLAVTLTTILHPVKASAAEYMKLSIDDRVSRAQSRYSEFAANPKKEYEVLISFKEVPYTRIATLLEEQDHIISAFHCFNSDGNHAYGGYTECENKSGDEVLFDYYASVYNLVVGQIESYVDLVAGLRESYQVPDFSLNAQQEDDCEDFFGKEIDTSPIIIEDQIKEPDVTLEDELIEAEQSFLQFVAQKNAMDNGNFYVYGMRIVMTGEGIEEMLANDWVELIEILDFDNNNVITPIRP